MITATGDIFYQDSDESGGAFYRTIWETVGDQLDITTTISIPFVWGEDPKGFIKNGILFRWGLVSVNRQVLRPIVGGYELVAEGGSQFCDYVQMNYPCQTGPSDPFTYHLDCGVSDETEFRCTEGPCWADPDDPNIDVIWSELDGSGNPISGATFETLEWIDVWTNV